MSSYQKSNLVTAEYVAGSQPIDPSGAMQVLNQETSVRNRIRQAILAAQAGAITGPDSGINVLRDAYLMAPPTFSAGIVLQYLYAPIKTAANRVYCLAEPGNAGSNSYPLTANTEPTHTNTTLDKYDGATNAMWAYLGSLNVLPANADTPVALVTTPSAASVTQQINYNQLTTYINFSNAIDPAQLVQRYNRQIVFGGGRSSDSGAGSVSSAPAIGGMQARALFRCNTTYIRFVLDGVQSGVMIKINGKLVVPGATYPSATSQAGFNAYEGIVELQLPDNTERCYEVIFVGSTGSGAQINRIMIDAGATMTPWYPNQSFGVATSAGLSITAYGSSLIGSAPPMLFTWTFPRWFGEFVGSKRYTQFAVGSQGFYTGTAGLYRVWEQVNKNPDRVDKNCDIVICDGLVNDSSASDANIAAGFRRAYAEKRALFDNNRTFIAYVGHLTAPLDSTAAANMARQENLLAGIIENEFKPQDPNIEFIRGYTGCPQVFTGRPGTQMPLGAGQNYPEGNSSMYHDGWGDTTHYGLRGAEYLGQKWFPAALLSVL